VKKWSVDPKGSESTREEKNLQSFAPKTFEINERWFVIPFLLVLYLRIQKKNYILPECEIDYQNPAPKKRVM